MTDVLIAMERPTPVPLVFGKGMWVALFRKQGQIDDDRLEAIPRITVEMRGVRPDPDRVRAFACVCGFPDAEKTLPTPFPETMFLTLMARIFTSSHFPLSPLGLIHTDQTIVRHGPLEPGGTLDLTCRLTEVRRVERGVESTCTMEVARHDSLVWEGSARFLSRSRATRRRGRKRPDPEEIPEPRRLLEVPGDTGRRFARASSDYSPHHMTVLTARLLGFPRPIAHGMWTLSRALAELEREHPMGSYRVEAGFKRPILMPAKVALTYPERPDDAIPFSVYDPGRGTPHLVGRLDPLPRR